MSLIPGFLQGTQVVAAATPKKQDATSTIQTLSLRLSSATHLEDRRAAILGLRSFARDYKELVASEGLRELIATMARDREDLETVKALLETLLTLFVRDEANPESSEDIALWLTDEFTQKQENITILLDLLKDVDFYIRLYTLQLLAAISQNRPVRTQECVFTAPLGVARLVSILEDKRDAIRNEAVLLIIHLSAGHTDIQKLITFQGTLDQLFAIVEHEGGVDGGIVVQDCLQLMSNLLSFNVSNQNYFRETGCVPKLAKLLTLTDDEKGGEGISPSAKEQRDANVQYALRLLRLFVVPGGLGTVANQNALVGAGLLHIVTTIAFLSSCELPARAEALKAVADLIDGNESLQHSFSQIQVALPSIQPPPPPPPPPASAPAKKEVEEGAEEAAEGIAEEAGEEHCGVIEALLDLALWDSTATGHAFDARFAACRCLEAYFHGNSPVRTFFLKHAIELHSVADPSPNALTSLLRLDSASRADPYRVWIASVIAIHLIYDDTAAKALAAEMREGDADAGEEVVTAIQGISANLVTALQHQYDPRIAIGFLMLLCIWLYGDSDAVDDFLSETSSVQSLVSAVKENGVDPVVQGLATFLLGILYEFSHQTSPVTRLHLHQLLATQMTRDLYVNKITVLRSHPLIRDFEASKDDRMPGHRRRKHGLPEVYFDHVFIEFLKENYSTVMRAIDKAPELETRVLANGTVKASNGVNLEELQSLRAQLAEASERLERIEADRERERQATEQKHSAALEQLERDRHDEREALKAQHSAALVGLEKAKRNAETQLATAQSSSKRARDALNAEQRKNRDELDRLQKRAEADKVASEERLRSFVEDLTQRNRRLMEEKEAQLKTLREQAKELPPLKRRLDEAAGELEDRERKLDHMRRQAEELVKRTNTIVAEREERLQVVQARLQEAEANFLALQQASEEVQRKAAAAELERQTQQEEEQGRLRGQLERAQQALSEKEGLLAAQREEHDRQLAEIQRKIEAAQEEHVAELESSLALADELKENLNVARKDLAAAAAAAADDLQRRKQEEGAKSKAEEGQLAKAMQEKEELQKKSTELQTEIEDLFMVMGDLEEKRKNDKKRLKELGAEVSDDDDDDVDDDDVDDDDVDDDEDDDDEDNDEDEHD